MKIWENISDFKAKNPAITIGSFDGVHLGHQEVIKQLNEIAHKNEGESVIFTFSPHPIKVLNPDKAFVLLTTIEEKLELFKTNRVDHVVLFPFTHQFSQLSYEDFVQKILVEKLGLHTLLVGYDNTIGKNREGNYSQLLKLGARLNFNIAQQKKLATNETDISSTIIRNLLTNGKLLQASKLLGYHYVLSGTVVHGQQIGNKLGFPTANLLPAENKFVPGNGVYAILVEHQGILHKGMMNIGIRPTIDDDTKKPVIEAHLFNFDSNLYQQYIKISVVRKLRDEYNFNSIDALRAQLKKDKDFALLTLKKEFGF